MKRISITLMVFFFVSTIFAQNLNLEINRSKSNCESKHIYGLIKNNSKLNTDDNLILNESFEGTTFPPAGWSKTNGTTIATNQWKRDNLSPHTGSWGARVEYLNALQSEWLITPSINLTTLNYPVLEFWWNMSYYWGVSPNNNCDFRVKVSTNGGTSWTTIWTEDSAGSFENFKYYKKEISLLPYQNQTALKIAFQYYGNDGADLYIDDIKIGELPVNRIEYAKIWAGSSNYEDPIEKWSGYSKIPYGQKLIVGLAADIKNTGSGTQNNLVLHAKEIVSNSQAVSGIFNLPMFTNDTLEIDSLMTFDNVGNYKLTLFTTSDSIYHLSNIDTFNVNVNKTPVTIGLNTVNLGVYSRDNNYYDGWGTWGGIEAGSTKPFIFANLYEINSPTYASSIEVVLSGLTKPNTLIKGILYRGWDWQNKTIVAETDYHTILQNEIPAGVGNNPRAINLFFTNNDTPLLQKDTAYFAAIQGFGGSDTVYIAIGSYIPQPTVTSFLFDFTSNSWKWSDVEKDPKMIRLKVVDQPVFVGIDNVTLNAPKLFQNIPNPSKERTLISYELNKQERVTVEILDLMGRIIKTYSIGNQNKGLHSIEVDLTGICPGSYLYSLKTQDYQQTRKMIIW